MPFFHPLHFKKRIAVQAFCLQQEERNLLVPLSMAFQLSSLFILSKAVLKI
ncbi:hypothetical protein HMPREF1863_01764 [Aedoeadaptatus coxii]|uniref:Uncharacterized protein n=1 Tax=Aedoeadaptatus coxii TaxID=755172 RepID=A0A134AC26_9FIRM|nr:hypothetical protein HMPREF1863_01764 [Peptoniphilus coxii]